MTEQEAFEQWLTGGPFAGLAISADDFEIVWTAACEWQRSVCNEELVMLRQRIAELEKLSEAISRDCNNTALERNALQAELAAANERIRKLGDEVDTAYEERAAAYAQLTAEREVSDKLKKALREIHMNHCGEFDRTADIARAALAEVSNLRANNEDTPHPYRILLR